MTINLNNAVAIHNAIGEHDHWSSKPVICVDTGEVFISATDAAKSADVKLSTISSCCLGRIKTCKGKVYRYLSNTSDNVDALVAQIRALNAKQAELESDAAVGRAIREEREAKQKREEEIAQVTAELAELLEKEARAQERYQLAIARRQETERKLNKLLNGDKNND